LLKKPKTNGTPVGRQISIAFLLSIPVLRIVGYWWQPWVISIPHAEGVKWFFAAAGLYALVMAGICWLIIRNARKEGA
jgi:hypothetical protein